MFNFTCRESYLIEDGKKTKPVKGATLIGSCMDIIPNIDAVGDDLDFGPGICGKGQSAEANAGQPTVRIRGINVSGTRANSTYFHDPDDPPPPTPTVGFGGMLTPISGGASSIFPAPSRQESPHRSP